MISSFFDDVNSLDCYTEYLSIFRWWSHHFNPLSYCDVTPPPPPLRRTPRLLLLVQKTSVVSVQTGRGLYRPRYYPFPKTFHLDEPFHLNSPQNYLIFCTNDKHSCFSVRKRYHYRLTELKFFNEISYEFGIKQSEASLNVEFLRSLLRRHFAGKTVVASTVFSWLDLSIVNTFSAKRTVTEVKIRSWLCKIHLPD